MCWRAWYQRLAQPWGKGCICTPCFKTGGAYLKFEIVCFCPCWKKLSGGADSKTPLVTSLLLIFSSLPKIHCYNPYLFLSSYSFIVGRSKKVHYFLLFRKNIILFCQKEHKLEMSITHLFVFNWYSKDNSILF